MVNGFERKSVKVDYVLDIPNSFVVFDLYNSLEYKENLKKEIDNLKSKNIEISNIPVRFEPKIPEKRTQEWYKVASEYLFHTIHIYNAKCGKFPIFDLSSEWYDLIKQQKETKNRKGGLELSTRTLEKIINSHNSYKNNETIYYKIFLARKKMFAEKTNSNKTQY